MSIIKIALIHKNYTIKGGMEKWIVRFSRYLIDIGHDVHFFAASWDDDIYDERITFHKVKVWGKRFGIQNHIFAKNAYQEVNKYNFDIVQTFSRLGFGDVIRIGAGCHEFYKKRFLESVDSNFYRFKKKIEYKFSLKDYLTNYYEAQDFKKDNYKKIVAISQIVKDEIMTKYNVPCEDIIVNHNGVNIEEYSPEKKEEYRAKIRARHNLKEDDLVLLFIGTGFRRKGLKYIFAAMTRLPKVKLLVVGKGKINKFRRKAKTLGIEERVTFVGFTPDVELYYSAADIFVFPTIYEPFGNVIAEALASGLPVITTQIAGGSEIIDHGKGGFILKNPDDIDNLVGFINKLSASDVRVEMGREARKTALRNTEKANHEKFIEIYREILNN